jgi:carboxyl-terminal processing protease
MRKVSIAVLIVVILVSCFFVVFYSRHRVQPRGQHHIHQQSITGIGVQLTMRNHALEIVSVLPDTPAAKAGLHGGLIIQQIDGSNIAGKPLIVCVALMRGPVGSQVQLQVIDLTANQTNIVEFTREKISIPVGTARPAPINH